MPPSRRRVPLECSRGVRPSQLANCRARANAWMWPTLPYERRRGQQADAGNGAQARDHGIGRGQRLQLALHGHQPRLQRSHFLVDTREGVPQMLRDASRGVEHGRAGRAAPPAGPPAAARRARAAVREPCSGGRCGSSYHCSRTRCRLIEGLLLDAFHGDRRNMARANCLQQRLGVSADRSCCGGRTGRT